MNKNTEEISNLDKCQINYEGSTGKKNIFMEKVKYNFLYNLYVTMLFSFTFQLALTKNTSMK